MSAIPNLHRIIDTLARFDDAGLLEDFLHEVAEATRGPSNDLDRYPHHRYDVGRFARLASRLLDLPIGECHAAAIEALLPATRRGVVLEILYQFEERLDQQAAVAFASRPVRRERRRA